MQLMHLKLIVLNSNSFNFVDLDYNFFSQVIDFFKNILDSRFFLVIKFVLGVYAIVLFIDIVLLLILRGLGSDFTVGWKGANVPSESRGKMAKKWSVIMKRLDGENISQYKASVLEADAIVDNVLEKIGYPGENMNERLQNITAIQIENIDDLRAAHDIRNNIVYDQGYEITIEEARSTLGIFEKFLHDLEIM
ncbi:hypothetical protein ACFL08_03185 [Patescibacteria group bacterium]